MMEIDIKITGNQAEMRLVSDDGVKVLGKIAWEDKRDLSSKLFEKMDMLLGRSGIPLRKIGKVSFVCDSPYFARKGRWQDMKLENIDGTGRCGFTAWQTGEIISKVMDFALEKE
jgi:hypothetical protein